MRWLDGITDTMDMSLNKLGDSEGLLLLSHFSRVRLFVTQWIAAHQASLSITNFRSSLKLMSIELVMPSNHLILCHPLLLLPSIFPSIRVFSNESALPIRWPKYQSFSFNISPSNEHPGLISFRMDWLDLLVIISCKSDNSCSTGIECCIFVTYDQESFSRLLSSTSLNYLKNDLYKRKIVSWSSPSP